MALLLFEESQRVAPFDHEVLPRSQRTVMFRRAGSSHERNFGRVSFRTRLQRVAPFYPLPQISHSRDFDFHNFSSPGFLTSRVNRFEVALAIRLIIGRDFAVTRSSPEYCCNLFDITSEQSVEQKWLMKNKHNK